MTKKKTRKPTRRKPVRLREKPPPTPVMGTGTVASFPPGSFATSIGVPFYGVTGGPPEDPKDKTIRELRNDLVTLRNDLVTLRQKLQRGREMFSKLLDIAHAGRRGVDD